MYDDASSGSEREFPVEQVEGCRRRREHHREEGEGGGASSSSRGGNIDKPVARSNKAKTEAQLSYLEPQEPPRIRDHDAGVASQKEGDSGSSKKKLSRFVPARRNWMDLLLVDEDQNAWVLEGGNIKDSEVSEVSVPTPKLT